MTKLEYDLDRARDDAARALADAMKAPKPSYEVDDNRVDHTEHYTALLDVCVGAGREAERLRRRRLAGLAFRAMLTAAVGASGAILSLLLR